MTAAGTAVSRIPSRWVLFGTAVAGLLGATLWLRSTSPVAPPAVPHLPPSSVAVLPFVPRGPDTAIAYLGTGLAELVSGTLGRVPGLRVAGSASAAALIRGGDSLRAVGRRLGVGSILDGTVRYSSDRVRVTARLVSVDEGFDLWSEIYDIRVGELSRVPHRIAVAVVEALRSRGGVTQMLPAERSLTRDVAALHEYLVARAASRPDTAVAHLMEAVRLDSAFALAHAALARAYVQLLAADSLSPSELMPRARDAAERAVVLDSGLAEPHVTLALVYFLFDRNWAAAEREFRHAIALNPSLPDAHLWYAHYLLALGRPHEALGSARRARGLEPMDLETRLYLGWHGLLVREYDVARVALREVVARFPLAWQPLHLLGLAAQAAGDSTEALARLTAAQRLSPNATEPLAALGWAHAMAGRADQARQVLVHLRTLSRERYVSPVLVAYIHAALGERRAAFAWLDRGIRDRSGTLVYLRNDPRADRLRGDPRYPALLRRLGLP